MRYVVEKIKKGLTENTELGLENYLRDILNEAEDINFWQPRSCYPIGVALARAYAEDFSGTGAIEQARKILNSWCLNSGFDDTKRLIYTDKRIKEHIQELVELGVVDRRFAFHFDILEAWLIGVSRNFPADNQDREALFKGALTRIRLPEIRERISSGAQATIYRFNEDGVNYALRTVSLTNQNDRKRFHNTIAILDTLKKHTARRDHGTEYIYNLRDVGIAANERDEYGSMIGVEIYQWVDGICLLEKLGRLNAMLVVDIGIKLARALNFIHLNGIFHRDVCPRNIILENRTTNPILIDFGLAKYGSTQMHTVLNTEYTAPEIVGNNPKWSSAADIFSLGKTLHNLTSEADENKSELIDVLESCIDPIPRNRPDAKTVDESLEKILFEMNFSEKRSSLCDKLQRKCNVDLHKDWFSDVIDRFKSRFLAISLGLHDEVFDRCAEVAQFLDFVLEAYPTKEPLKLSYVLNKPNEITGDLLNGKDCIRFMSNLRIERSHYDEKKSKNRILKRFKNPDNEQIIAWAKDSTDLLAQSLSLNSLPIIVDELLKT